MDWLRKRRSCGFARGGPWLSSAACLATTRMLEYLNKPERKANVVSPSCSKIGGQLASWVGGLVAVCSMSGACSKLPHMNSWTPLRPSPVRT